jgi:hypothetical protein
MVCCVVCWCGVEIQVWLLSAQSFHHHFDHFKPIIYISFPFSFSDLQESCLLLSWYVHYRTNFFFLFSNHLISCTLFMGFYFNSGLFYTSVRAIFYETALLNITSSCNHLIYSSLYLFLTFVVTLSLPSLSLSLSISLSLSLSLSSYTSLSSYMSLSLSLFNSRALLRLPCPLLPSLMWYRDHCTMREAIRSQCSSI